MVNLNGMTGCSSLGASEYDIVDAIRMLVKVLKGNLENNKTGLK